MGTKFTTRDFIEKANDVHDGKYDYSKTVYTRSRDKVTIVCFEHGPFEQRASAHLEGCGCPVCGKVWSKEHKQNHTASARASCGLTTEEWVRRADAVHHGKYDYSLVEYVNQRQRVKIICPKHGMFLQQADSHLRGSGCRLCGYESENHIGKHFWSDSQRQQVAETCLSKYGAARYLDSLVGKAQNAEIRSDPAFRAKMRKIISSDAVQEKIRSTSMARYGAKSPTMLKEVQDKIYASKKKNHTVNSSKSELRMYNMLVERFGEDAVVHQYKSDEKYPFVCDFYVRTLDLYIELNAHWSHGYGWFLGTQSDLEKLSHWIEKMNAGSAYYREAIRTWTERDVAKREAALRNGLNYLVFWRTDLSDFIEWLDGGCVLMNNILK